MTQAKTLFTKDLDKKQMIVVREFAAPVDRVWPAWTEPALLDQWWAPRPYRAETKSMDFRVGGTWLYAMIGPDGVPMYCKCDYQTIDPQRSYSGQDAFCDEQGNPNPAMPSTNWHIAFEPSATGTKVTVTLTFKTVEDINRHVEMGFEQGFSMAHGNLDELLAKQ